MRLFLVRHGHPDYRNDCLTELGHLQAEAVGERLKNEKIDKIFSSPMGRARQTAEYIAKHHNLEVVNLDFMHEITWGPKGGTPNGAYNPWEVVTRRVNEGAPVINAHWQTKGPLSDNLVCDIIDNIGAESDKWLADLGYVREGDYYRVGDVKYDCVVVTSHGGSSCGLIARLLNLPFSFMCASIKISMTGITVIEFSDEKGRLCSPVLTLLNDDSHARGLSIENKYEM